MCKIHNSKLVTLLLGGLFFSTVSVGVQAAPAPDAKSVLILEDTVTGGVGSVEATQATALGLTPVVVSSTTWAGMSAADFASYRALVLGDATCNGNVTAIAAAEANSSVWGTAVKGNVIIVGTDPVYHVTYGPGAGPLTLVNQSIKFAADDISTGAYIDLSCYYAGAASGTAVPVLAPFGSFTVVGQGGCPADAHIVAVHPALASLTDADLSNWSCSVHEGFVNWPSPQFLVLAIAKDIPSPYVAPDGTTGAPYILARGKDLSPILCGNGIKEGTEQCDDGNTTNGDGCSAQCTIEVAVNRPPVCTTASVSRPILWPPNHKMSNESFVGVTDPDGDAVTITTTTIFQDEVTKANKGDNSPDGAIASDGTANVRVERDAHLNGRVYHISFTAADGKGGICSGEVRACVPHDQGKGNDCVDEGSLYNSLLP